MPNRAVTRSMAHPNPDAGSQNDIVSLLKKISSDNDKIQRDMLKLREDNLRIQSSIEDRMELIQTSLEHRLDKAVHSLKRYVGTTVTNKLIDEIFKSTSVVENDLFRTLLDAQLSIDESISSGLSKQNMTLRSDIAGVQDALRTLQNVHDQPGFTLFPRLPPEIRLEIWKLACYNNPSIVKLHTKLVESGTENVPWFRCVEYRVPAVLHTSRESRQEASKWYKKRTFNFDDTPGEDFLMAVKPKYFNFDVDVLYPIVDIDWWGAFGEVSCVQIIHEKQTLREFRRIALTRSARNGLTRSDTRPGVNFLLEPTSKIEEIILVADICESSDTRQCLVPIYGDGWHSADSDQPPDADDDVWIIHHLRDTIEDVSDTLAELANRDGAAAAESANEDEEELTASTSSTPDGSEARDESRNTANKKLWPKFTIMALRDACPRVSNVGITMG